MLEQYKAYIGSQERMNAIGKLLSFSYTDSQIPPDSVFTEFGNNIDTQNMAFNNWYFAIDSEIILV